jgi:CubicO group peptidase (beta-lactamase class C family)
MTTSHPDTDWKGRGQTYFPEFTLDVTTHQDHLIPLERGIILSGEVNQSFWNIIVAPGKIWSEPGDNGYTRAALPFTLTDSYIGQARNGVATFVFNNLEVSPVAIQITQETAARVDYIQTEFRASVPLDYEPAELPEREQTIQTFQRELDARLPVRPWSDLPDAEMLQTLFNMLLMPDAISAAALIVDDVLYVQPVQTRAAGVFPYPQSMRHGVFSVTKTLAMSLSMLYAAERYGEQVFNTLITDYVPELASHPGWAGVTFEHALGMVTGVEAVDSGARMVPYLRARTALQKIAAISHFPDAPPRPGESFFYASTNTFVLSYALNQYVRAHEGPDADYWTLVKENVLEPMGIPYVPVSRTAESDGSLGVPQAGYGAYPTVEETAKIAKLFRDEGAFEGRQLLHRGKTREAMHRASRRGYDAGSGRDYLHAMWLLPVDTQRCDIQVPTMSGLGGNLVLFLPSGLIAIRFADADNYEPEPMVYAAEAYRSSCR